MWRFVFGFFIVVQAAEAGQTFRICIYGDNRGANPVERAILRQAKKSGVRMFVIE